MTPNLKFSQSVVNRLTSIKTQCSGKLYGVLFKNAPLVVGVSIEKDKNVEIAQSFPTEIDLCGVIDIGKGFFEGQHISRSFEDIDVTDNPIYASCQIGDPNSLTAYFVINDRLHSTSFEVISEQEIYTQFVHIRLKAQLPFICELTQESVKDTVKNLKKLFTSGRMAFSFPRTTIYLMGNNNEDGIIGLTGNPSVNELCDEQSDSNEVARKKKNNSPEIVVISVNMFKRVTADANSSFTKQHGPIFILDKRNRKSLVLSIPIDTLSMVQRETKLVKLYEILLESSIRNLRLFESSILKQMKNIENNCFNISVPEVYHFFPEACGHFLTRIYFKNEDEEMLRHEREVLHDQLLLPAAQPLFRRANKFLFKEDIHDNDPLINPHVGINPTGNGGKIVLVKGKYKYYHYRQQNLDDDGWGCAYRSLQTLASWFVMQGYVNKPVPTHKEIQQCLVDIGDKPASFVGSRQWIGSTEVNFVLNTLLNVTCKILYVSSGEELGTKGPELVNHFKTNGTPVMIGGGVLAHTILGVDYNSQTGNLKFLILDPHYTGSEDIKIIQNKGWCGWKGVDFWEKSSYYNMCLPQISSDI